MTETRFCSQCRTELPLEDFYMNGPRPRSRCCLCERFNARIRQRTTRTPRRDPKEMSDWLPVEPFRDWLIQRMNEEETTVEIFASRIGMSARRLSEVVGGRTKHARVDVVDRALLRDGWHLSQLYPHLYPDASPFVIGLLSLLSEAEAREAWDREEAATLEGSIAA